MKLTDKEFKLIRPLEWSLHSFGGEVYNTTDTPQLFWIDFMRFIFAPYYRKQRAIVRISKFDITQPVLLTADLQLTLPTELETVVYIAKNQKTLAKKFIVNLNAIVILILSILILMSIYMCEYFQIPIIEKNKFIL